MNGKVGKFLFLQRMEGSLGTRIVMKNLTEVAKHLPCA